MKNCVSPPSQGDLRVWELPFVSRMTMAAIFWWFLWEWYTVLVRLVWSAAALIKVFHLELAPAFHTGHKRE